MYEAHRQVEGSFFRNPNFFSFQPLQCERGIKTQKHLIMSTTLFQDLYLVTTTYSLTLTIWHLDYTTRFPSTKLSSYFLRFKIKVTFRYQLCYNIKVTFGESSIKLCQTNWNVAINNVNVVVDELPIQIIVYTCLTINIWTWRRRRTSMLFYALQCHPPKMVGFQWNWR